MDEKKKIKIQQKLIDQLTKENAELREQVLYLQTVSENSEFNQAVQSMKESKAKYDKLIEEIKQLKEKYHTLHDMYKKLIDIDKLKKEI